MDYLKKGVVAQNAFKLEISELQIFFLFNGLKYIYSAYIFERISIFYHVGFKIPRLENLILVIYAIYIADLFLQKHHYD